MEEQSFQSSDFIGFNKFQKKRDIETENMLSQMIRPRQNLHK